MSRPSSLLALLAAAALASGCASPGGLAGRALELVAAGGERVLNEPMRPIRGTSRVLLVALDGVSDARLREALAAGEMPRLAALLGAPSGPDTWAHAAAARDVLTILPAETSSGWAAVFTGATPAETGVTGNEWFDRTTQTVYAPVPLSVRSVRQTLDIYTSNFFGDVIGAPTLFEQADVRAHVAMGFVYRGADLISMPDPGDLPDLVRAAFHFVAGSSGAVYSTLDSDAVGGMRRGFRRHGVPDLQVVYLPGVDLIAHAEGPDAQRAYLGDRTDRYLGDVLDAYRRAGVLGSTHVVVVADHGHTESLANERQSLDDPSGSGETLSVLEDLGRRPGAYSIGRDTTAYDAVMLYNEAFANVYLADASTCAPPDRLCDWTRPPRLDADVLPVARAYAAASRDTASAFSGALDLVFARASNPTGPGVPFQVLDGDRLVPIGEYLQANPRPDLLDLERRLTWLTDGPRGHHAGDVMLLATGGADRPIGERYYFGSPRLSGHGSPSASDSVIPIVVAHTERSGEALREAMRAAIGDAPTQLDIARLVIALLAEGAP